MLLRRMINGGSGKVVAHFGATAYISLDSRQRRSSRSGPICERAEPGPRVFDQDGKPVELRSSSTYQRYKPGTRALRADRGVHASGPARPGMAASPQRPPTSRSSTSLRGSDHRRLLLQEGRTGCYKGPDGGIDTQEPATQVNERSILRRDDSLRHHHPQGFGVLPKPLTDIENRSGALVTPAGVVFHRAAGRWLGPTTTRSSKSCGVQISARRSRARR